MTPFHLMTNEIFRNVREASVVLKLMLPCQSAFKIPLHASFEERLDGIQQIVKLPLRRPAHGLLYRKPEKSLIYTQFFLPLTMAHNCN